MSGRSVSLEAPPQTWRLLCESGGISASEYRCRVEPHPLGGEEQNQTYSIVFIRRGLFVRRQERDTVVADANHVLFFGAGRPYHVAHPIAGGDDCTVLAVEPALAFELVARHDPRTAEHPKGPFHVGHALSSPRAGRLHYELLALVRGSAPHLALDEVLAELAEEALRSAYGPPPAPERVTPRQRELAQAAMVALNQGLDAPPRLSALGRALGCSPFHLSRTFRRTTGASLRAYLGRLRSRAVADRLAAGAPDLTALALSMGYADHSHMTNAFRREWGVPPSRFRALDRTRKNLQAAASPPA